jgi:hypothetical protein
MRTTWAAVETPGAKASAARLMNAQIQAAWNGRFNFPRKTFLLLAWGGRRKSLE